MKYSRLLKTALLLCAPFLWLSCSSWEEVAAPTEFVPLKITSVSPNANVYVGDKIIITGENFIEKKEYNQVWFGGNVRGNVDSVTSTKLFLKVPEGAQSGMISVSNGVYADTLKSTLTIAKESPFKNASLAFDGFTAKRDRELLEIKDGTGTPYSLYDSINITCTPLIIQSCLDPYRGYVSDFKGNSFGCMMELPSSDTNFHCLIRNYTGSVNSTENVKYDVIEINTDHSKSIFKTLIIAKSLYSFKKYNQSFELDCQYAKISLTNVPFITIGKEMHVKLNSSEIQQCNFAYTSVRRIENWQNQDSSRKMEKITIDGIFKILPDAYFEMTLE